MIGKNINEYCDNVDDLLGFIPVMCKSEITS